MIRSMTGFGEASLRRKAFEVRAEVRSVNHKRLQIRCLLPPPLGDLEHGIEEVVRARLGRGSVTVTVQMQRRGPAAAPQMRLEAARAALRSLRRVQRELGVGGAIDLRTLLSIPGVMQGGATSGEVDDVMRRGVVDAVQRATAALIRHRTREGAAMGRVMQALVTDLRRSTRGIERRAPRVIERYRERLGARVRQALESSGATGTPGGGLRPEILVREVALFADRADITEELTRLEEHLARMQETLRGGGEVGRRVEFLLQEILRETNTIGSKANDGEIAGTVIAMKEAVEKLRELAANLE